MQGASVDEAQNSCRAEVVALHETQMPQCKKRRLRREDDCSRGEESGEESGGEQMGAVDPSAQEAGGQTCPVRKKLGRSSTVQKANGCDGGQRLMQKQR